MIRSNLRVEDGVEYHPEDLDTGYNVVLRKGCIVGHNVKLWSGTVIDAGAIVLDRARIHCNCYIAQRCIVGRNVFMGPGVILTNDRYPMRADPGVWEPVIIQNGVIIGGGVIICPGVTIGDGAMIGAGAVVTKDVPHHQAWAGNPAKRMSPEVEERWLLMREESDLEEVGRQELEFYQPDERVSEIKVNEWKHEYQYSARSKQEHGRSHLCNFKVVDVEKRMQECIARYDPARHKTLREIEADAQPMLQGKPMALFTVKCRWWATDINDCYMKRSPGSVICNVPCCPHCEEPIIMVPLRDFLASAGRCTANLVSYSDRALELAHASNLGRQFCFSNWASVRLAYLRRIDLCL